MGKLDIDFYFVDKVNFHKRNFENFISYVERNHTYEYNEAYPALKARFGEYYYRNIKGLPNFNKYENLYKELSIDKISDLNVIKNISYKGYKLWEITKAELNNYLSAKINQLYIEGLIDDKEEDSSLLEWLVMNYKQNDESLINIIYYNFSIASFWIDYWPKIFKEKNIKNLCVFGGTTIFSRVATLVAQWNNINVIAFEGIFLKEFHYADNASGIITNNHIGGDNSLMARIKPLAFLDNQQKWLEDKMNNRSNLNVIQPIKITEQEFYNKYKIDKSKKIALLIGQVINDFSITQDLELYSGTIDFYIDVIKKFSEIEGYHLFIKLHPWENHKKHNISEITKKVLEKRLEKYNYDNYTIDYDINIETLIDISEFGITSCSQSGLEMLYEGKRVLQVGNAFYGNKGWTYDIKSKDELKEGIEKIINNNRLSDNEIIEVRKYMYHLLYNYAFVRNGEDKRFAIKLSKISNLTKINNINNTTDQVKKDENLVNVKKSKNSVTKKIFSAIVEPKKIYKYIIRRVNKFRYRNFKVVNMVMGHNVKSKIFEDMLNRFEIELNKNKYIMKVTSKPINNADIYHYWRPNIIDAKEMKHPSISTVHHDLVRDSESLTIRHFIEAYRNSNLILCLNTEQKELLGNYLDKNKKINVIPHGYDKMFKAKNLYKKVFNNDNKMVIGLSSRRYDRLVKGEETLYKIIEATKELPIKWLFIGQNRKIEGEFCAKNNVEYEVYESIEYNKYPELYRKMDLFIITSKAEGGPASLPEALASGVPVLSTPCGFVRDFINNNENGYIFDYNNHKEAIKYIEYLVNNPKEIERMGKNSPITPGLQSWEEIIERYINEYKDII